MIFTDSIYRKLSLYFIIAASSVFILLTILGIAEYRASEYKLQKTLSSIFNQSIQEQVKLNMEGEFVAIHNNQSFEKGAIRTQRVVTEDTTIAKEVEVIEDMGLELFKNSQTYLSLCKHIQPQELQQIFDSKLQENGLMCSSVVLIRHHQRTQTSGDTTKLSTYYRIPVIKGGVFDEIDYEGFIYYSTFLPFKLMSKSILPVLLFIEILMLGVIAYFTIEKRKIKPDKIVKRGRCYYMGITIFDIGKCELIGDKNEIIAVTKKPSEMLLMFLRSDEHRVEKNTLKETLWPDNPYTVDKNLTSTVNKLRNFLKEVDCTFNLVTKKGDEYYELKFIQDDMEAKKVEN
ncbi:helix-turn-helix domain-containing protein [Proteiniphilum sp. X52]|uniref:winged helix-turn-helix domain-containing protein n=1 Tax=Proteiniphilum sp. X52 TaxID=2382159 RepID=UPI000F0A7A8E|nr:helix-turn-helix domain-containing protein [Proteiniphilum sp. X52]RNC64814.1 helix-turn-helix domain-containing protein [Proteiniphilum sp. X52]